MNNRIAIYDTTLRDGSQAEGVSFSLEDKLRIAHKLDEFGMDYVESGWPGSNPKDIEFFDRLKRVRLFDTDRLDVARTIARSTRAGGMPRQKNMTTGNPGSQDTAA